MYNGAMRTDDDDDVICICIKKYKHVLFANNYC